MSAKRKEAESSPVGVVIDPLAIYTADDCLRILKVCRATLTRYIDDGFPLKPLGTGRAIGKDILEWIGSRESKKQARGGPGKNRQSRTV